MAVLNHRLKAFSLVEVITAMVIIMIVFALGLTITLNVFASNGMERNINARLALDAYIAQVNTGGVFKDGNLSLPPYELSLTVEPHPNEKKLIRLSFLVSDSEGQALITENRWAWQP